jgi:hypothetical protein
VVAGLRLPVPFTVDALCERLSADRGRPIRRLPMDLPDHAPCGLLVSVEDVDYVIFEQRTTPLHRDHILLHELAHVLLQHQATPMMGDEASHLLLPHLDPGLVRRMLARSHYSALEEQQAELVASLILERASEWTPEQTWAVPPAAESVISRVEQTLRGRGGSEC